MKRHAVERSNPEAVRGRRDKGGLSRELGIEQLLLLWSRRESGAGEHGSGMDKVQRRKFVCWVSGLFVDALTRQVLLPPCPTRPPASALLLSIITILQLRAKKGEREPGAGDQCKHAGGSPAGLGACLLVGGAHKTVEETRKKGTNRAYMDWYLLLVPGREDVERRSLPAFSAPDARRAKGALAALGVPLAASAA